MTNRIVVAAVFLAGCAVGGVSSQLVVPKASAQQTAALTRWEMYCRLPGGNNEEFAENVVKTGNALGSEGWEPAFADMTVVCWKRPRP